MSSCPSSYHPSFVQDPQHGTFSAKKRNKTFISCILEATSSVLIENVNRRLAIYWWCKTVERVHRRRFYTNEKKILLSVPVPVTVMVRFPTFPRDKVTRVVLPPYGIER